MKKIKWWVRVIDLDAAYAELKCKVKKLFKTHEMELDAKLDKRISALEDACVALEKRLILIQLQDTILSAMELYGRPDYDEGLSPSERYEQLIRMVSAFTPSKDLTAQVPELHSLRVAAATTAKWEFIVANGNLKINPRVHDQCLSCTLATTQGIKVCMNCKVCPDEYKHKGNGCL